MLTSESETPRDTGGIISGPTVNLPTSCFHASDLGGAASTVPDWDPLHSAALDALEGDLDALSGAFRELWPAVREGGPVAHVVQELIVATAVVLRLRRGVESEVGL